MTTAACLVFLGLALGYILTLELRIKLLRGRIQGIGQQLRFIPKRRSDRLSDPRPTRDL